MILSHSQCPPYLAKPQTGAPGPAPAGSACRNVFRLCASMSPPRVLLSAAIFTLGRIKAAIVYAVVTISSLSNWPGGSGDLSTHPTAISGR